MEKITCIGCEWYVEETPNIKEQYLMSSTLSTRMMENKKGNWSWDSNHLGHVGKIG